MRGLLGSYSIRGGVEVKRITEVKGRGFVYWVYEEREKSELRMRRALG